MFNKTCKSLLVRLQPTISFHPTSLFPWEIIPEPRRQLFHSFLTRPKGSAGKVQNKERLTHKLWYITQHFRIHILSIIAMLRLKLHNGSWTFLIYYLFLLTEECNTLKMCLLMDYMQYIKFPPPPPYLWFCSPGFQLPVVTVV